MSTTYIITSFHIFFRLIYRRPEQRLIHETVRCHEGHLTVCLSPILRHNSKLLSHKPCEDSHSHVTEQCSTVQFRSCCTRLWSIYTLFTEQTDLRWFRWKLLAVMRESNIWNNSISSVHVQVWCSLGFCVLNPEWTFVTIYDILSG